MTNFLEEAKINRKYKNDLFVFLFGTNKEFALSLYNAMNNSHYTDPDSIIFNTIENFIYIGRKNDVSFLIENTINVYEHQTTINANIALRMFLYVSKLYERYAYENKKDLYSEIPIRLPNPNFVVFYYGVRQIEEDCFIYLSQAMDNKNANLELRVRVINANYGHNQHILNRCPALYEYSWFLQEIRIRYNMIVDSDRKDNNVMIRIVDSVLETMPDDFLIKEIIMDHKAEVTDMLYTIEDEPRMMAIHEEALRKEGYEKARDEDINTAVDILMEEGVPEEEAIRKVERKYNVVFKELQKPSKEIRHALYSIEDEHRMMAIHEEALRKEGYEKARGEDKKRMVRAFIKMGLSEKEAELMTKEEYNDASEKCEEQSEEVRNAEDDLRMMVIHEEALRKEGYEKGKSEARKEDLNTAVEILMEAGVSKEEAIRRVEEKYNIVFSE